MSDLKVCKVMTSYATTVVVVLPNSSNYKTLARATEKKHSEVYGKTYGEVEVTSINGFLRENDEGAGVGVSYPVDDESFRSLPFTNYLAQLESKRGGEKAGNSSAKKSGFDARTIDVLSPKSLIDANVKAVAKGSTPISTGQSRFQGDGYLVGGATTIAAAPLVPNLKSRFASEAANVDAPSAKKSKTGNATAPKPIASAPKPVAAVAKAKTPTPPSAGQAAAAA